MKKIILILLTITAVSFASSIDEKILKKLDNIEKDLQTVKQNQKMMKREMELRFEAVDKRFEAMDKRFEDMNQRFETLTNYMLTLTAGIFGLIGFMMWDRRTVVEKAKKECTKDIDKKADKEYVDRLIMAMNELLALKDETAKEVFRRYGLL